MTTIERVLVVTVDREDGTYVAHSEGPELAVEGETPQAALRAYVEALEALMADSGGPETEQ